MDINFILGIAGFVLSVVSLLYAVYVTKKSKQEKRLVYEIMRPVPIAEVIKGQSAYSLKVVYEKTNAPPVYIEHAVAQYIRFTNFGHIPINKNDLATSDILRLEIANGKVLDVSLVGVTRDVCQIAIGSISSDDSVTIANIDFAFLDYMDGGIIQVLSDTSKLQTTLKGTVVGMPDGIKKSKDYPENTAIPNWGCSLGLIITLLSLGASIGAYRLIAGTWANVWLLGLPFVALLVPFLYIFAFFFIMEPRNEFTFPEKLLPPRWYYMRRLAASRFHNRDISDDYENAGEKKDDKNDRRKRKSSP